MFKVFRREFGQIFRAGFSDVYSRDTIADAFRALWVFVVVSLFVAFGPILIPAVAAIQGTHAALRHRRNLKQKAASHV
jgi:hypothetical protein